MLQNLTCWLFDLHFHHSIQLNLFTIYTPFTPLYNLPWLLKSHSTYTTLQPRHLHPTNYVLHLYFSITLPLHSVLPGLSIKPFPAVTTTPPRGLLDSAESEWIWLGSKKLEQVPSNMKLSKTLICLQYKPTRRDNCVPKSMLETFIIIYINKVHLHYKYEVHPTCAFSVILFTSRGVTHANTQVLLTFRLRWPFFFHCSSLP